METSDFVRDKLTEWGFREFKQRFEDEGIDKETFLSLGDSGRINVLIPKIGPRVKFRKRLKEYLQWNSMETCDFVLDKLNEWDLSELIQRFEDQGIDKETFLSLEESGNLNDLIPRIGPRVKFRKRLREYLQMSLDDGYDRLLSTVPCFPAHCYRMQYTRKKKTERRTPLLAKENEPITYFKQAQTEMHAQPPEMMDTDIGTYSDQEDDPEMDPTIFSWHFQPTSTSDTDRGNEMSEEPAPNSNLSTGILGVILFTLRHHLTGAFSELMALLNFLSPNLVTSFKHPSDKIPTLSAEFYCDNCHNYTGKNTDDACCNCGTLFNKKSSYERGRFFLSVSLKDLLKDVLKNHGTELLPKTVNHGNDIKDVMDGEMYQNLLRQGKVAADDLTLMWNFDEVPIYKPARWSIWPLQFTINELPYTQRMENVIVAGLWFGPEKPTMNTFLKPFIDECCDLAQNPFQWTDANGTVHSSKVFSLVCSSEAVARPLLRNCKQFNGEYGCDWCLHPGRVVEKHKGCMRSFPYDKKQQAARSNEMFRGDAEEAENTGSSKHGVKGLSLLSVLPLFDIVFGFVPDYLHSVLMGVSKQLTSLWLNPVNSTKPWYVGGDISQMDSRLLCLKPPIEITRSPRSLKCWENWKAWEWREFLLFYAINVLPGILHSTYLEHYFVLSFSIHILLQESVSQHDLRLARASLVHFVEAMPELYGEENVSFNCHQLIHLAESVQNWGPLWATSTFSFERNNGNLRTLLNGIKDKPHLQIYQRFLAWQCLPGHLSSSVFNRQSDFGELLAKLRPKNDDADSAKPLGKSRNVDLTGSTKIAIQELLNRPVLEKNVEAYDSFSKGHTVYHSTHCKGQTDCVIKLRNGCCGEIQLILLHKENCSCTSNCLCKAVPIIVVHLYHIKPDTLFPEIHPNHPSKAIFEKAIVEKVEKTAQPKAFFFEDIRCKCMYVDGWLVPLPNTYERY